MNGDHHAMSQLWKWMGRSPATFHFHVAFESGSEPVDPRSSQLLRKAYMGGGGGDCDQPMFDRNDHLLYITQ